VLVQKNWKVPRSFVSHLGTPLGTWECEGSLKGWRWKRGISGGGEDLHSYLKS